MEHAEGLFLGGMLMVVGAVQIPKFVRFWRDPEFLREYTLSSPKSWLMRSTLGLERTIWITRTFAPLSILLCAGMVVAGLTMTLGALVLEFLG